VGGSAILGEMRSKCQRSRSWHDQIWSRRYRTIHSGSPVSSV